MEWIMQNYVLLIMVLFAMSEALAMIPAVKANSVFQLFFGILAKAKDVFVKKV